MQLWRLAVRYVNFRRLNVNTNCATFAQRGLHGDGSAQAYPNITGLTHERASWYYRVRLDVITYTIIARFAAGIRRRMGRFEMACTQLTIFWRRAIWWLTLVILNPKPRLYLLLLLLLVFFSEMSTAYMAWWSYSQDRSRSKYFSCRSMHKGLMTNMYIWLKLFLMTTELGTPNEGTKLILYYCYYDR